MFLCLLNTDVHNNREYVGGIISMIISLTRDGIINRCTVHRAGQILGMCSKSNNITWKLYGLVWSSIISLDIAPSRLLKNTHKPQSPPIIFLDKKKSYCLYMAGPEISYRWRNIVGFVLVDMVQSEAYDMSYENTGPAEYSTDQSAGHTGLIPP